MNDKELTHEILDIIEAADQAAKFTDGLADDKYIAYQEKIIEGVAALVARREATLARKILDQGHNLDCMFCGFKDKVATAALTTEATQGEEEEQ